MAPVAAGKVDETNGGNGGSSGGGFGGGGVPGGAGGSSFMRSARRRAIAQTMRPHKMKHGLLHSPTIAHTQNGTGTSPPKLFSGGAFKPTGF